MNERISRKVSGLQFVCALMIIALHTTFPRYFGKPTDWTLGLNQLMRSVDDAAISTFFFLSAYLLFRRADERRYGALLLQRMRTLAIPYVLWNAIFYAHKLLREFLVYGAVRQTVDVLTVLRKLTVAPANSIFWFLQTLAGFIVLFPILRWAVRLRWPAWLCGIAAMAAVCIPQLGIRYESMLYWLPVYLMGAGAACYRRERFEQLPTCACAWHYVLAAVLLLGTAALRPLGHLPHYLFWIPAPLLMWALADGFARLPRRPWWLECSFYLYCSHMVVQHYAVRLYQTVLGQGRIAFVLSNVLLPCLCAALALAGAAIARRLLPGVFAVLTGMRQKKLS